MKPTLLLALTVIALLLAGCAEETTYPAPSQDAGTRDAKDEGQAFFDAFSYDYEDSYYEYEEVAVEPSAMYAAGAVELEMAEDRAATGQPAADEELPVTTADTMGLERMMVYETEMTVLVDKLDDARDKLEKLIDGHHKAGVTDVIITRVDVTRIAGVAGSVTFEIRCHKDVRLELIRGLRGLGEIVEEFSTAEDITRQYVDLERSRDRMQREYDILKAEYDDAVRRGASASVLRDLDARLNKMDFDLSEAEGRLKHFDDLVTLPRITVTLTEDRPGTTFRGDRVIADGFEMAYVAIVNIVRVFVVIVGVALALALLGLPIFLVARLILRRLPRGGNRS